MMRSGAATFAVALLAMAACTTDRGDSAGESAADDTFTLPSGAGRDAKSIAPPSLRSVSGILTFDDIEGGCAYLEASDGTRYEVVYPAGWQLDRTLAALRGPAGEVALAGATVRVDGSIATGRSTICQVGPIFRATTVQIPGS